MFLVKRCRVKSVLLTNFHFCANLDCLLDTNEALQRAVVGAVTGSLLKVALLQPRLGPQFPVTGRRAQSAELKLLVVSSYRMNWLGGGEMVRHVLFKGHQGLSKTPGSSLHPTSVQCRAAPCFRWTLQSCNYNLLEHMRQKAKHRFVRPCLLPSAPLVAKSSQKIRVSS